MLRKHRSLDTLKGVDFLKVIERVFGMKASLGLHSRKDFNRDIFTVLDSLTLKEALAVALRSTTNLSLKSIGELFGVTPERVRQINSKALRKLRHPDRSSVLKKYIGY